MFVFMRTYRSHTGFNQQLLSDPYLIENGELVLKSVDKSAVVYASSSSFKRSSSLEMESYNHGEVVETDLISIDSCTKTIAADAFRKMVTHWMLKFKAALNMRLRKISKCLSRFKFF